MAYMRAVIKHSTHNEDGRDASGQIVVEEKEATSMDEAYKLLDEMQQKIGDMCDECYSGEVIIAWYDSSDGNSYELTNRGNR